jgi:hypothetical protein
VSTPPGQFGDCSPTRQSIASNRMKLGRPPPTYLPTMTSAFGPSTSNPCFTRKSIA